MGRPQTHGQRAAGRRPDNQPLYRAWRSLRYRCNNPSDKDYKHYGARGIKVSPRWDDYITFAKDMGPHPGGDQSIERINVNGNYEPGNCTWAGPKTQTRNRTFTKLSQQLADQIRAEYVPRINSQSKLARKYGVCQQAISRIIRGDYWLP